MLLFLLERFIGIAMVGYLFSWQAKIHFAYSAVRDRYSVQNETVGQQNLPGLYYAILWGYDKPTLAKTD